MIRDDDDTPVQVPIAKYELEALRVQLAELRKQHELWRPIVETAKILTKTWKATAGDFTQPVADAVDMLFRMVEAAEVANQRQDD